jgi:hypothetical protein
MLSNCGEKTMADRMDNGRGQGDAGLRRRVHLLLSGLLVALGLVLLTYMVVVESEPGAIPLLLVAAGAGWFFFARARFR